MKRCKVAISDKGVMCWTPEEIDMDCVRTGVEMLLFQLGVVPEEKLVIKFLDELKGTIREHQGTFKVFKKGERKWVEHPFQISRKELSDYGFDLIEGHNGAEEGVLLICKTESLN